MRREGVDYCLYIVGVVHHIVGQRCNSRCCLIGQSACKGPGYASRINYRAQVVIPGCSSIDCVRVGDIKPGRSVIAQFKVRYNCNPWSRVDLNCYSNRYPVGALRSRIARTDVTDEACGGWDGWVGQRFADQAGIRLRVALVRAVGAPMREVGVHVSVVGS